MDLNTPPSIDVLIDISANRHAIGKTMLAARLVKFFQCQGIMDVVFRDCETLPDDFQELVNNSDKNAMDLSGITHVKINEELYKREFTTFGLKERYGPAGGHPEFTREQWIEASKNDNNDDGYWRWLCSKLRG